MSDDDTSEEIVEEIHKHSDENGSQSSSERLSFLLPAIGCQGEETASASNLFENVYERILDPSSLSPDAKDHSAQPSQSEGHSIISECILHDSLTQENESEKEEKESGEEEVATKRPHKSLFQSKDHVHKARIFKTSSENVSTKSADVSPVSSDWSVESFKTQSSGSNNIYIKDRSVSEISVSVPKYSVFSLDSSGKVKSLVKQFSSNNEETDVPSIGDTRSIPRQLSLPVELIKNSSPKKSFVPLQHDEQCSSMLEGLQKDNVSCMVCYFSSQESEAHSCERRRGESPNKLSQLSPRVKASLEKIGACLSRGTSLDSQTVVEGRNILKSKENLNSQQKTRKVKKSLHVSEKENSPCHKAKLKESLEKIYEKKDLSKEKVKNVSDAGTSHSWSLSCQSSPTKSRSAVSPDGKVCSKEGNENLKNQSNSKATDEDVCDTEEEVEDICEEKYEKNMLDSLEKENGSVCSNIGKLSLTNNSHLSSVNCSLDLLQSQMSCASDGEPDNSAMVRSHSGSQEEKLSASLQKNEDLVFTHNRMVITPLNHVKVDNKNSTDICDTEEEVEDMVEANEEKSASDYVDEENTGVYEDKISVVNSTHSHLEPSILKMSTVSDGKPDNSSLTHSHSESQDENFPGSHNITSHKNKEDMSITNKISKNPNNHAKDNKDFCASESFNQSSDSKVQMAALSHLDACDGITSNNDIGIDNEPKEESSDAQSKEESIYSQSEKQEKSNLQVSECQSQSEFSLENESCDELLHIDVDHSGDDLLGSDFSDASEIMGFISKSPISAITERTEESGQEIENLNHRLEKESDLCLKDVVDHTVPGKECQSGEKHYPSLPLSVVKDDSSQFIGMSSVQEGSLVQTHASLQANSEPIHPHSSHSSASAVGQSSTKLGTKAKLPAFAGYVKANKRFENNATPPLSPTIKSPSGPVRATLHRSTSKSMHNLASNHGSKSKTQGLQNRSISVSTDSLERNSLRAKSLSPGPLYRQTVKCGSESEGQANLHRRCISAITLNEGEGQINLKRNKSFSLNKLNRSRSSSLTSIAYSKKIDYSQIPSKVRQYIKDMKEKDIRNSTRSLPSTPARSVQQTNSQTIIWDEKLLRELSQLDESDMLDDIREIMKQIFGGKWDKRRHEEILNLLINERKLRHASDTTLATLQLRYDNLNAKFAEKQNEIDRLRFYKDIHINKEYTISLKSQEERRGSRCYNTTPPITPSSYNQHYLSTPNLSRRSSYQATPSNTPIRALSPTISSSIHIKSTMTPITDPKLSITYETIGSPVFENSIQGDKTTNSPTLSDQEKIVNLNMTGSSQDDVFLQSWMKDANKLLNKVREFSMLEGSGILQQSERNIIWESILHQYWCLSSQFPVLTLLPSSHEPGQLMQELGQSLQTTASKFDLDLATRRYQEGGERNLSDVSRTCSGGREGMKKKSTDIHIAGSSTFMNVNNNEGRVKKLVRIVNEQKCSDKDDTALENSTTSVNHRHKEDCVTEQERKREQLNFNKDTLIKKIDDARENLTQVTLKDNDTPLRVDATGDPVLLPDTASSICEYDSKKSLMNQKTTPAKDLYPDVFEAPSGHGFVSEKIVTSPAHSRESMKTVGPLEKVKLWQASLIDPEIPHTAYQSSSNTSSAPSILSLDSSHPFDPHEDLNNSLTNFQLNSSQIPPKTGKILLPDSTGILKNFQKKKADLVLQSHSVDSNSLPPSADRMECDLPKSSCRSNSITPRLTWGRTVKARDLDSGCPGSEQSTRVSHNASFDQQEQLDLPNLQSSSDGLDATNNNDNLPAASVKPLQISRCEDEKHADHCVSNEHLYENDFRSTRPCNKDKNLEHKTDVLPSSNLVTVAFPKHDNCKITEDAKSCRTLSGSKSSRNSSKNKRDHYCRDEEIQKVKQKQRNERPLSSEHSTRDDSRRRANSRNSKVSKNSAVNDKNSSKQFEDYNSDMLHTLQRNKLKKLSEMKTLESNEKSRGKETDLKLGVTTKREQNINSILPPAEQCHSNQMKSHKYTAKYVIGNSSDLSDISTCSHHSSHNIHNKISKLKRDFNIIKSQMMNLTSEVFHENKRKRKGCCKRSSDDQSPKCEGGKKPIKALDMSVYSDGCENDSDLTAQSSHIQQEYKYPKSSFSRSKPTMLMKTASKSNYHTYAFDGNSQDSQEDTSNQFSNSSMETISDSFVKSEMEKLPKSTPKSKESQFKEQTAKYYPSTVDNRIPEIVQDLKQGKEIRRKLLYDTEVQTTEITEQNNECKQSFRSVSCSPVDTKHASIQTENRDEGFHVCKSTQASALAIKTLHKDIMNESSQTEHKENQSIQVPDTQLLTAAAPVIYIENYNCGSKTSEVNPVYDNKHKAPPYNSVRMKHRRTVSAHELMVSLDEATSLAERLRLRSENMLSYLNLNLSVHSNLNSS